RNRHEYTSVRFELRITEYTTQAGDSRRSHSRRQRWHCQWRMRSAAWGEVALFEQRAISISTRHLSAVIGANRRSDAWPRTGWICVRIPVTRAENLGKMDALRQRRLLVASPRPKARL